VSGVQTTQNGGRFAVLLFKEVNTNVDRLLKHVIFHGRSVFHRETGMSYQISNFDPSDITRQLFNPTNAPAIVPRLFLVYRLKQYAPLGPTRDQLFLPFPGLSAERQYALGFASVLTTPSTATLIDRLRLCANRIIFVYC